MQYFIKDNPKEYLTIRSLTLSLVLFERDRGLRRCDKALGFKFWLWIWPRRRSTRHREKVYGEIQHVVEFRRFKRQIGAC